MRKTLVVLATLAASKRVDFSGKDDGNGRIALEPRQLMMKKPAATHDGKDGGAAQQIQTSQPIQASQSKHLQLTAVKPNTSELQKQLSTKNTELNNGTDDLTNPKKLTAERVKIELIDRGTPPAALAADRGTTELTDRHRKRFVKKIDSFLKQPETTIGEAKSARGPELRSRTANRDDIDGMDEKTLDCVRSNGVRLPAAATYDSTGHSSTAEFQKYTVAAEKKNFAAANLAEFENIVPEFGAKLERIEGQLDRHRWASEAAKKWRDHDRYVKRLEGGKSLVVESGLLQMYPWLQFLPLESPSLPPEELAALKSRIDENRKPLMDFTEEIAVAESAIKLEKEKRDQLAAALVDRLFQTQLAELQQRQFVAEFLVAEHNCVVSILLEKTPACIAELIFEFGWPVPGENIDIAAAAAETARTIVAVEQDEIVAAVSRKSADIYGRYADEYADRFANEFRAGVAAAKIHLLHDIFEIQKLEDKVATKVAELEKLEPELEKTEIRGDVATLHQPFAFEKIVPPVATIEKSFVADLIGAFKTGPYQLGDEYATELAAAVAATPEIKTKLVEIAHDIVKSKGSTFSFEKLLLPGNCGQVALRRFVAVL